jgi:tetratricopeptide (TPR) repeat protein/tRNA A-37 threonylcarbamoyl transferase component Bud32/TolB-like protein
MERAAIGPYRIVDRLGAGGMGEVFLAFDTRLGRKVALKSLTDASLDTPRTRDRLLREARAAAHITHPNIAAIYDVLDTGEHPCIVMEYAQGETLSAIASRGPMAWREVTKVALQLVDALAHAHASGVVHRDLKPLNVVLTPDGIVKVLDFGLARVRDVEPETSTSDELTREQVASHVGRLAGTTAYMAPEQFVGKPASHLSDIYSLGVTLYELLTGRRPFDAASAQDLIYQIVSKPTPRVTAVNRSVPPHLDAIVAKAMARDPAERYQSAAEMGEDLRQASQDSRPESRDNAGAGPGPPIENIGQASAARTRRIAILAAALAVVTLAVSAYVAWRDPDGTRAFVTSQSVAVLPFAGDGGDAAAAPEATGYTEAVIAALEGLSAVSVASSRPDEARYVETSGDLRKRAVSLGVTLIVSGSVTRRGGDRHVGIKVERPHGSVVLSKSYQGTAEGAAALQARAVQDIVSALNVSTTPADRERLRKVPACRPDTYVSLAAGRAALDHPEVDGRLQSAETVFADAAAKDHACALAHAGLADVRVALYGRTRDAAWMAAAERPILEARRLDPDSPAIKTSLAFYYIRKGLKDQAESVMRDVIGRRPFDDTTHRVLADILEAQGRIEEALAELQIAVDRRPGSALNHIVLGNFQFARGRYAEALQSYDGALRIQPDNAWAASNTCAVHAEQRDYQRAADCYKALPADATNLSNLGAMYYFLGRFPEALDACRRAVEMDTDRSDIKRWNLADAYLRVGDRPKATEQLQAAADLSRDRLAVNRQDARAMARHAYYDARLGRRDEALRHAAVAAELSRDDRVVLYRLAVVHAVLGQSTDAVAWLERALQAGYDPKRALDDAELDPIKYLPRAKEMLRADRREAK